MKKKDQIMRELRSSIRDNIQSYNQVERGYAQALQWVLEISDTEFQEIIKEERKKLYKK